MSATASALGDFQRARREHIRPEDVGLYSGPCRGEGPIGRFDEQRGVPVILHTAARLLTIRLSVDVLEETDLLAASPTRIVDDLFFAWAS